MIREFSIVLFATEWVILIVSVAYFLGINLGYLISNKVTSKHIIIFSIITFFIHLNVIFLVRIISGSLWQDFQEPLTFIILFFIGATFISSFYSIFLPRFISISGRDSLPKFYSLEILGGICGIILILVIGQRNFLLLSSIYFSLLTLIIYLLLKRIKALIFFTIVLVIFLFNFKKMDKLSTEYFYNNYYNYKKCKVLASIYSPYQKIDVIEDAEGNRHLYLNGLQHFDTYYDPKYFIFYLSALPVRLKDRPSVLIIGGGSLNSVYQAYPFSGKITTVEIDRKVIEVAKNYFKDYNHIEKLSRWQFIIDDGKHFLGNTPKKFDVIIFDIPYPYWIQVALLNTKEFYTLVKSKLSKGGIISISVSGRLTKYNKVAKKIVKSVILVFNDLYVINSRYTNTGFIIAGDNLSFDKEDIVRIIKSREREINLSDSYQILTKDKVIKIVREAEPVTISNLNIVREINLRTLPFNL